MKSSYEVSIWGLKSDKNKLTGQVRRQEVKGRSCKSVATGKDESIEMFARKLELKHIAEENRYTMKARQVEIKKEREKEARRRRASELHSQIAIIGCGRFGYGVSSRSSTIGGREDEYMMSSSTSTHNLGRKRDNRVHRGTSNESSF